MLETFDVRTREREEMVDVTALVADAVERSGIAEGLALVYCPHTTAAITINENADPSVVTDVLEGLRRTAPRSAGWKHAEGNADAHVKSTLVGASELVPVSEGALVLGTWQAVYFCEFDGPRSRRVHVQVLG